MPIAQFCDSTHASLEDAGVKGKRYEPRPCLSARPLPGPVHAAPDASIVKSRPPQTLRQLHRRHHPLRQSARDAPYRFVDRLRRCNSFVELLLVLAELFDEGVEFFGFFDLVRHDIRLHSETPPNIETILFLGELFCDRI